MSDWADEEAAKLLRNAHWSPLGQSGDADAYGTPEYFYDGPSATVDIATALRAAERKGLERAKAVAVEAGAEALADNETRWPDEQIPGEAIAEEIASAIQSLIDKPETEEKR